MRGDWAGGGVVSKFGGYVMGLAWFTKKHNRSLSGMSLDRLLNNTMLQNYSEELGKMKSTCWLLPLSCLSWSMFVLLPLYHNASYKTRYGEQKERLLTEAQCPVTTLPQAQLPPTPQASRGGVCKAGTR